MQHLEQRRELFRSTRLRGHLPRIVEDAPHRHRSRSQSPVPGQIAQGGDIGLHGSYHGARCFSNCGRLTAGTGVRPRLRARSSRIYSLFVSTHIVQRQP